MNEHGETENEPTREDWEEYERKKSEFENSGLKSWEYEARIQQLVEELEL